MVMVIVIYVDGILVAGSDEDCKELLASLNKEIPIKDRRDGCCLTGVPFRET